MLKITNGILSIPGGENLLSNINLEVPKAKLVYLSGPNGIGKTSLIKAILGIEVQLSHLDNSFESYQYLPQIENKDFLMPIQIEDISPNGLLLSDSERSFFWNKASGGQRKKALLERILKSESQLYILDEPFNHLDDKAIELVNTKMEEIIKKNKSIILISHLRPKIDPKFILEWDVFKWK